jgi:hypothetical protein
MQMELWIRGDLPPLEVGGFLLCMACSPVWGCRPFLLEKMMIKGLAITPPVIGRISIGRVVARNDKRIPVKDDQFTVTTQIQTKEGWVPHPLDAVLRHESVKQKLRTIPVSVLFDDADLNLRADYSLFDRQTGRLMCAGDGQSCRRHTDAGVQVLPCPSPAHCDLAQGGLACKLYGRLHVRIDAEGQDQASAQVSEHSDGAEDAESNTGGSGQADTDLGSFVFRTTGYNSVRTLAARLQYYQAVSGGKLASMPLELKLRGKSTTMSRGTPIYYADLTVREGWTLPQAVAQAQKVHQERMEAGFDQATLDEAARAGFNNGGFEESDEDGLDVVDEFYATQAQSLNSSSNTHPQEGELKSKGDLASKLQRRVQTLLHEALPEAAMQARSTS